jgi:hypothetical protein
MAVGKLVEAVGKASSRHAHAGRDPSSTFHPMPGEQIQRAISQPSGEIMHHGQPPLVHPQPYVPPNVLSPLKTLSYIPGLPVQFMPFVVCAASGVPVSEW